MTICRSGESEGYLLDSEGGLLLRCIGGLFLSWHFAIAGMATASVTATTTATRLQFLNRIRVGKLADSLEQMVTFAQLHQTRARTLKQQIHDVCKCTREEEIHYGILYRLGVAQFICVLQGCNSMEYGDYT